MPSGSLALVSCVLRMVVDVTSYDVSLATTASTRNRPFASGVLGEADLDPRLALSSLQRDLEVGAAYFPRFTLQEQTSGVQALHRASMGASWQANGRWRLVSSADGSYGSNDFLLPPASAGGPGATSRQPPGPIQPIPRATALQYVSAEVAVGVAGLPAGRVQVGLRLSGFVSGGADADSREALPLERGARLGGELAWTASGSDVLVSSLAAVYGTFGPDSGEGVLLLLETWRHTLTPDARLRIGLGPGFMVRGDARGREWGALPSGEIAVSDRWVRVLDGDLRVRAEPVIDRVTRAVYERAEAGLSLAWRPRTRWRMAASGTASVVIGGAQAGDVIALGEVGAAWLPSEAWEFALGVRRFEQIPRAPLVPDISETTAYVTITVRDRGRLAVPVEPVREQPAPVRQAPGWARPPISPPATAPLAARSSRPSRSPCP